MKKAYWYAAIPGIIAVALAFGVGLALGALFIVKWLWAWTIPSIFPGAVAKGLIVKSLSWFTAFKVAVFIGAIGVLLRLGISNGKD